MVLETVFSMDASRTKFGKGATREVGSDMKDLGARRFMVVPGLASSRIHILDAANPRAVNAFGHIIEINEDGGDFTAPKATWDILLKCGDPPVAEVGATFSPAPTAHGWFGMPDNCAVDSAGRLWVATDGNSPKATGRTDGLWAVDTEGEARATSKLFFRVPVGAELCGPLFTADDQTAFLALAGGRA